MAKRGRRSSRALEKRNQRNRTHREQAYAKRKENSPMSIKSKFFRSNIDCFHNLSSFELTDKQKLALILGGTFIAKNVEKTNVSKKYIFSSLRNYFRLIFLKKHFLINPPVDNSVSSILRVSNPYFNPTTTTSNFKILHRFKNSVCTVINERTRTYIRSKKTRIAHRFNQSHILQAIQEMLSNPIITVKQCDKGLGFAVMNTSWYIEQCLLILRNSEHYTCINNPPKDLISILYDGLVYIIDLHSEFCLKNPDHPKFILQNFSNPRLKLCTFYGMPKIHKGPNILLRPICSNINYPIYHGSKYVHNMLLPIQEFYSKTISDPIIKNSFDLIGFITTLAWLEKPVLISADVTSLYPNIPLDIAIQAIRYILYNTRTQHILSDKLHIEFIISILDYSLRNCYISFCGEIYLQIKGTAMGTPCAVVFSNLFMIWHSENVMKIYNMSLQSEHKLFNKHKPYLQKRFIDDIFTLFRSKFLAERYITCFNSFLPSIQIDKPQISDEQVDFLDTTIYVAISNGLYVIYTKLYAKQCNKYIYLPPTSFHRPHIFNNWIRCEFERIRIICFEDYYFYEYANIFIRQLLKRGYDFKLIKTQFYKVTGRQQLLNKRRAIAIRKSKKPQSNSINLPNHPNFVTLHTPLALEVLDPKILLPTDEVKSLEQHFSQLFPTACKPRIVFKNPPNIAQLLTNNKKFT